MDIDCFYLCQICKNTKGSGGGGQGDTRGAKGSPREREGMTPQEMTSQSEADDVTGGGERNDVIVHDVTERGE